MLVDAKVCELTDGFLWFVCGLYVGIMTSPLTAGMFIYEQLFKWQYTLCLLRF